MENDKYSKIDENSEEESEGAEEKNGNLQNNTNNTKSSDVDSSSSCESSVSSYDAEYLLRKADEITATEESEDPKKVEQRNLPAFSVPEKIVLCIDLAEDPEYVPFKVGNNSRYPPLYMIKRVVEIFLYSKLTMNSDHEFAVVVLQKDAVMWVRDFTSDPRSIIQVLEDLSETTASDVFDLSLLFDLIAKHVKLPIVEDPVNICPPYIVRAILLYSRSYCIPEFRQGRDSFTLLTSSDYFTLDALYIHEEPSTSNKCEEIFNVLDSLDEKGFSYVFEVSRNATKLHDNMAKLLSHPHQRPLQKSAIYKLKEIVE